MQVSSDEVVLLADLNRDGDLNDTREHISYRFRSADKKLQRRPGSWSYQTLVEEVGAISFALGSGRDLPMSPPQHRVVVGVRSDPDAEDLSYTLCPIFL